LEGSPARAAEIQERRLPSARGCTARVGRLRQEVLGTPWEVCIERARWYTEVYAKNAEQPIEVIRALAFRKTLEETPIHIHPGELLVGHRTGKRVGAPLFPEVKLYKRKVILLQHPVESGFFKKTADKLGRLFDSPPVGKFAEIYSAFHLCLSFAQTRRYFIITFSEAM